MGTATFSNNGNYYLDVDAALSSQNRDAKTSTIYWRIIIVKTYGYGSWASTNMGNSGSVSSSVGGLWSNGNMSYDFRNGSMTGSWVIADGYFNVTHRPDGTAEYYVSGNMTLANIGSASAGTGWRSLPRLADVPAAPTPLGVDQNMQTSLRYRFSGNSDGGSPIREWQIGYGTDPNYPQFYTGSNGTTVVGALRAAETWYFWSRGRNDLGWGPWSMRSEGRTVAGARVNINGVWKEALPYVKVNGVWRLAQPYINYSGDWRQAV